MEVTTLSNDVEKQQQRRARRLLSSLNDVFAGGSPLYKYIFYIITTMRCDVWHGFVLFAVSYLCYYSDRTGTRAAMMLVVNNRNGSSLARSFSRCEAMLSKVCYEDGSKEILHRCCSQSILQCLPACLLGSTAAEILLVKQIFEHHQSAPHCGLNGLRWSNAKWSAFKLHQSYGHSYGNEINFHLPSTRPNRSWMARYIVWLLHQQQLLLLLGGERATTLELTLAVCFCALLVGMRDCPTSIHTKPHSLIEPLKL